MFDFFISMLILSNIVYGFKYLTGAILRINFRDTFISWNIITIIILLWICLWKPMPQTLDYMLSFIK